MTIFCIYLYLYDLYVYIEEKTELLRSLIAVLTRSVSIIICCCSWLI